MPVIRFVPGDIALEVPKGTLLIDAVRQAGLPIARACGDDLICALCGVRVLEGSLPDPKPVERRAKERNRIPDDLRLACAIRVRADLAVTADYWGGDA